MTHEEINNLLNWAKQMKKEKAYAREIAEGIEAAKNRRDALRYNETISAREYLTEYDAITRKEIGLCMKIKHFFKMVYPEGSAFDRTLKGKDYLDHLFTFRDFVEGPVYGIKVNC